MPTNPEHDDFSTPAHAPVYQRPSTEAPYSYTGTVTTVFFQSTENAIRRLVPTWARDAFTPNAAHHMAVVLGHWDATPDVTFGPYHVCLFGIPGELGGAPGILNPLQYIDGFEALLAFREMHGMPKLLGVVRPDPYPWAQDPASGTWRHVRKNTAEPIRWEVQRGPPNVPLLGHPETPLTTLIRALVEPKAAGNPSDVIFPPLWQTKFGLEADGTVTRAQLVEVPLENQAAEDVWVDPAPQLVLLEELSGMGVARDGGEAGEVQTIAAFHYRWHFEVTSGRVVHDRFAER